jgi:transcriptional regulator with XRE-family HTH domain
MAEQQVELRNRIIGLLLRAARERAGKSKRECAEAIGVSTRTITAYEAGRKPASLPELEVLAYLLDIPASEIWQESASLDSTQERPALEEVMVLRQRIVGALLRKARLEAGLSIKELAGIMHCTSGRISAYEYGRRPIPFAELELAADHLGVPIEYFLGDRSGPIGEWHRTEENWRRFTALPQQVQEFVLHPLNIKYLEVAMKLSEMSVGDLRQIAEGLLDITY